MSKFRKALLVLVVLLPSPALAITVEGLVTKFKGWINLVIPIVIGIGLIYFLWGLATFINNSGDEKGREEGKSKMVWGILGLFVMISIWGLVEFVGSSLDIKQGETFDPPKF
jgi:hypothetical protein